MGLRTLCQTVHLLSLSHFGRSISFLRKEKKVVSFARKERRTLKKVNGLKPTENFFNSEEKLWLHSKFTLKYRAENKNLL